jgi:hypothetical protein
VQIYVDQCHLIYDICDSKKATNKSPARVENELIEIHFDLYLNFFLFLSGARELVAIKDKLGRFTAASLSSTEKGVMYTAVIDRYYLWLVYLFGQIGIDLQLKYNKQVWVTHDVDEIFQPKKYNIKHLLKNSFQYLTKGLWQFNYVFSKIEKFQNKYGFKSIWFLLPNKSSYQGYNNADYDIQILKNSNLAGTVGVHGGFGSAVDSNQLISELLKVQSLFENFNFYNRFHFLMFDFNHSVKVLRDAGVRFDFTLGYNDSVGLRNHSTRPFYLFDFNTNTVTDIVEIPLVIMDISVFDNRYMHATSTDDAWQKVFHLLNEIKDVNGNICVNWHSDTFENIDKKKWIFFLEKLFDWACENDFKFKNNVD